MSLIKIFVCGDVMTGRGIDQIMPHPGDPTIYESYIKSARGYVELAERVNGPMEISVDYAYIWGDALGELENAKPDIRLINLETSITKSDKYWAGKGINYRMHPLNAPCLSAPRIDACSLSNNHVIDWGYTGLFETIAVLEKIDVKYAGAGKNLKEAQRPAILNSAEGSRVLIYSCGHESGGIPLSWAAAEDKPGVYLLEALSDKTIRDLRVHIEEEKRQGDMVIVSIHWGGNWGFEIPAAQVEFAHRLIDFAGADIIHGHSSHHVRGIDVYKGRPILYGCGDFLNDYEGIGGYEEFRGDLALMYFITMDTSTGKLAELSMTPTRTRRFRVNRASRDDALWIKNTLNREGMQFGTQVDFSEDGRLVLS